MCFGYKHIYTWDGERTCLWWCYICLFLVSIVKNVGIISVPHQCHMVIRQERGKNIILECTSNFFLRVTSW